MASVYFFFLRGEKQICSPLISLIACCQSFLNHVFVLVRKSTFGSGYILILLIFESTYMIFHFPGR